MKKLFGIKNVILLILVVFGLNGCVIIGDNLDDLLGDELAKNFYKEPTASKRTALVDIPDDLETLSQSDMNALATVTFMGAANAITSFSTNFTLGVSGLDAEPCTNGYVYSWEFVGFKYWITYTDNGTTRTWEYEFQTPDLARFTLMTAEEAVNGKSGSWVIYDEVVGHAKIWDYEWSIDSSDNFTATATCYDEPESTYDVVSNANGSGSFVLTEDEVDVVTVNWTADGETGTYSYFDGEETYEGSWGID